MTSQGTLLIPRYFTKADNILVDKYQDLLGSRNIAVVNVQRFKIYMGALVEACNKHMHDFKKAKKHAEKLYRECIRPNVSKGDFNMSPYASPALSSCALTEGELVAVQALVRYFKALHRASEQNPIISG